MAAESRPFPAEEAATTDLEAFKTAQPLTNAEVAILLGKYEEMMTGQRNPGAKPPPVVVKAREYVERLNPRNNETASERTRELLQQYPLYEYEFALLVNLVPESADEAMTLIPSLKDGRLTEIDLEGLLADLATLRSYE